MSEHGPLSDDFLDQVKTALENLYDFPLLHRHPLAQVFANQNEPPGHLLRREIIDAIESLHPGDHVGVRSTHARQYNLLHMHYVGGMTLQEAANDLGISLRQAYRDLRRGQESVGELLQFNRQSQTPPLSESPPLSEVSSVESEVMRLRRHMTQVRVQDLVTSALNAVDALASDNQRQITARLPQDDVIVTTNPIIAKQILIHLLSLAVQGANAPNIDLSLKAASDGARLDVMYTGDGSPTLSEIMARFVEQLKWSCEITRIDSRCQLTLQLAGSDASVLIIDDNEGLVDLMKHYLANQAYQVISANSGAAGLDLAINLQPDVIIMDLMMPGMDGWELLQRLRTDAATRDVAVVICSVINDPELAFSLGASCFVAKPVNQEKILNALAEVGL
jgi:CheY-like chemotaxis protein